MDTGDIECFPVVSDLTVARVTGFGRRRHFESMMQVLFTDRVSSRLQSLRVEGTGALFANSCVLPRLIVVHTLYYVV
jgi:hypothetical protein